MLTGHTKTVRDVRFSHDGNRIATASWDGTMRLWHRRRPEYWWGVAWLPEFWLTVLFAGALVWSVWRDRKSGARITGEAGLNSGTK
jgi:WD40 repeat protein